MTEIFAHSAKSLSSIRYATDSYLHFRMRPAHSKRFKTFAVFEGDVYLHD